MTKNYYEQRILSILRLYKSGKFDYYETKERLMILEEVIHGDNSLSPVTRANLEAKRYEHRQRIRKEFLKK
nr:MAG TPA: hypothetical protein [Bacteriophage sp.]